MDPGSTPIVHDMAVREDGSVIAAGGDVSADQSFIVRLLGETGGTSPGVVGFPEENFAEGQESSGQAVVRVRRTGGSDGDVSVTYRTMADAEATADQDFTDLGQPAMGRWRFIGKRDCRKHRPGQRTAGGLRIVPRHARRRSGRRRTRHA